MTLRDTISLEVLKIHTCVDKIDQIIFSPDSCYILCILFTRGVIQVFSLSDKEWNCRINEGICGLISAVWTPDSRNIITESDFGIQLCIWSLSDSTSSIISNPKHLSGSQQGANIYKTYDFSEKNDYFCVLHRHDLQDYIGVYSIDPWNELTKFKCRSNDTTSVRWFKSHIVAVDSILSYRVIVYTPAGEVNFLSFSK